MARKLSDREWEVWAEFLSSPRFKDLARGLSRQAHRQRQVWAERLWSQQSPNPADPALLEVRAVSLAYSQLACLSDITPETRRKIEELLHDDEPERNPSD